MKEVTPSAVYHFVCLCTAYVRTYVYYCFVVYRCLPHSVVFWLGDLNYRIILTDTITSDMVKKLADNFQLPKLLAMDQVRPHLGSLVAWYISPLCALSV